MDRGLNPDGTIAREGSLSRVPTAFAPVVAACSQRAASLPGLHSAYLYGSIPRGTAVPGVSDVDLVLIFAAAPPSVKTLETALDNEFDQVNGVGIVTGQVDEVLSELERHDWGFFLACLCTPLLGPDLAAELPQYRPTSLLARETNGDLGLLLPQLRARTDGKAARVTGRKLVRTGFTLVMPQWGGWTSDLEQSAEIFGEYYPERATQMRTAADTGRTGSPAALDMLLTDLGPWLADEYTTVHGTKAPRPG
jgi:uncharacterized protein